MTNKTSIKPLDPVFKQVQMDVLASVCSALEQAGASGAVAGVIKKLTKRMRLSIDSLYVLGQSAHDGYEHDAVGVLRGIYDAHLQALYAIQYPDRAELFNDFYYIDRARSFEVIEKLGREGSLFAQGALNHPMRAEREPFYQKEFDKVSKKFVNNKEKYSEVSAIRLDQLRNHWYEGSLRKIAKDHNPSYGIEYEFVMHYLCSVLHASCYGLDSNSFDGNVVIVYAWHFLHRVMHYVSMFYRVEIISETARAFLKQSLDPMYKLLDEGAIRSANEKS